MEKTKTTKFLGSFSFSKNGGGAGGTTNYDNLTNKPKVNGIVLSGNKTSADLGITTLTPFPSTWPTAGKFEDLLAAIRVDTIAVKGASFLGEVTFDDLPANLGNAEIKVEILEGTTPATKVIHSVITSGNREPYRWEYTSWNSGNSNSGWISFQLPLTAGDGISIENNVISITGGNVYTQSNLLGGKSIEIVPEPVEGGIDENTLSCFHLDGTAVDEVTGYTLSPTMDNSVHKFGTGSSMWTNSTNFPWSLNSYKSFSFDYWYYHKTSRSSYLGLTKTAYYTYLLGLYFSSGATKPNFCVLSNKHSIDVNFEQNKWTHVYVYYNAEDRSFHLFVNGKEVFSVINSTDFSGVKEFANDGYTESRFDEIRISKCIRWTEDFEPPTEPYSVAVPTGNKVINNTGVTSINTKKGNVTLTADDINVTYTHEGAETTTTIKEFADTIDHSIENINSLIPVNAYTAENLVAGKNITIEEVLPEGGIDNHTKGCWHFDGNNENAATVGLMNITTGSISQYFEDGKFGKCARLAQNAVQTGWAPATVSADYSYDYWLLCTRALNTRICGMGSSTTENGKFYVLSSGKVASYIGGDPDVSKNPAVDMPLNTWMHLAYCKKDGIGHWFVNGKLIDKRADPGYLATMQISAEASNTSYKFDELRISDIARWTEDFEPPTQPYSLAVPTGKTAINNAITKTSQLTNDSGFITSVNSKTGNVVLTGADIQTTYTYNSEETTTTVNAFADAVFHNIDNVTALIPTKAVTSDNVTKIVKLTQAEYNALETKDDSTFYAIVG